ncbi:MAG TPA: Wzz/FepE/Etk N-terminal domain-containing protein [Solirubrobacteraceae bacterium]|nr:Wzz/FepE/Etk N-terminal domain-containing protein [Solirubrobacteraceae bacterium]
MNETTDATAIFAPLWRRKWLILLVGIVVGGASYLYYKHAQRVFQATTQIYLGASAEEQAPGEKTSGKSPATNVANQAAIINSIIVEKVHQELKKQNKANLVRGSKVRAKATEKSEFIVITTEAHTATGAALIANLAAQSYVHRQRAAHQRSIEKAISISRRQLRRIEAASVPKPVVTKAATTKAKETGEGKETAASKEATETKTTAPTTASILQAANLNSKINQLESSLALAGAQQVKQAKPQGTTQLAPKPRKNAIFGFVIGIVLAAIAAYVLSRFDRRLRSLLGIEAVFGSQTLTALPKVRRPVVVRDGQPAPSRFLVEPLRRLHTGLTLGQSAQANRPPSPRVILFTSADAGDGKSTLVADLALVQRDAAQRVVIVEANFRRPVQGKLLGVEATGGLAEVLAGSRSVSDALQRVHPIEAAPLAPQQAAAPSGLATAVAAPPRTTGSLSLLGGGGEVVNPPALLGNGAMSGLLRSLTADFDYVLIDAPSPLAVSDVMPLLSQVDGIVVVARVGHTRETSAQRLVELLARTAGAPVLGVAANCVSRKESERFGFTASNGPGKLIGR